MFVYRFDYPFEVDPEQGLHTVYHPTRKAGVAEARELVARYAREWSDYALDRMEGVRKARDGALLGTLTIKVTRARVTRLNPASFCAIINSRGGNFVEETREEKPVSILVRIPNSDAVAT